jgi:predicted ArsR family transcriptional regulator
MPRYPEKDRAPDGYITPQTAAEVLGVSEMIVRNHLKEGKLEGMTVPTEGGKVRHYASRAAVAATLAAGSPSKSARSREIVALEMEEITLRHMRTLETILENAAKERKVLRDNQETLIDAAAELAEGNTRQREVLLKILEADQERRRILRRVATSLVMLALLIGIVAFECFGIFAALGL